MSSLTQKSITPGALDEVSSLLRSATTEPELRRQIVALVRLPPFHRTSVIESAIHEMTLCGEPEDIRAAFGFLATDEGAAVALQFLSPYEKKTDPTAMANSDRA